MPTNFPGSIDTFSNPAADDPVDASSGSTVPHHLQHTNLNDAVEAIETYVLTLSPGGSPGGTDTQVQFNDGGGFGGSASLTFAKTSGAFSHGGSVSSGANSFAVCFSTASGDYSHSEGASTIASGGASHAEGEGTLASADDSHAEGNSTTASAVAAHAGGKTSVASLVAQHARSDGGFGSQGDGQYSTVCLSGVTTGSTPLVLMIGGGLGGTDLLLIRAGFTYAFAARVCGRKTDGSKHAAWTATGLIHNEAGTTSLAGAVSVIAEDGNAAGWALSVTADDTNDALQVQVTGEATVRWVAKVDLVEVGS